MKIRAFLADFPAVLDGRDTADGAADDEGPASVDFLAAPLFGPLRGCAVEVSPSADGAAEAGPAVVGVCLVAFLVERRRGVGDVFLTAGGVAEGPVAVDFRLAVVLFVDGGVLATADGAAKGPAALKRWRRTVGDRLDSDNGASSASRALASGESGSDASFAVDAGEKIQSSTCHTYINSQIKMFIIFSPFFCG